MTGLAQCQSKTKSDNKEVEDIEIASIRECIMHSESSPQTLVLQCQLASGCKPSGASSSDVW